jgi:hypothetical protein
LIHQPKPKGNTLTENDPFASAPADDEATRYADAPNPTYGIPAAEDAAKSAAKMATPVFNVGPSEGKVVLTFKGGTSFDAPWIVIHAASLQDAYNQVTHDNAVKLSDLMDRVQVAGQYFAGKGKSSAPAQQRQAAPAGAQSAPAGAPPAPGPDWTFKSGVSKQGKPWKGWMPPRGSDERPLFF